MKYLFLNTLSQVRDSDILALFKFGQAHLHDFIVQSVGGLAAVSVVAIALARGENAADSSVGDALNDRASLPVIRVHGCEAEMGRVDGGAANLR